MAYVDESGDKGLQGSRSFALAAVLLTAAQWPGVFDELIDFRRFLRRTVRLPVRAEVKANHIIGNRGAFRSLGLSEATRYRIYRMHMRLQPKLDLQTFAVVIDKAESARRYPLTDPREIAWEWLFQRIERYSTKSNTPILVLHDEGETLMVRRLARKARRAGVAGSAFGTGVLRRPARLLVDDPVPRNSSQSYLLQLADLAAYAAFRRCYSPPPRVNQIVPTGMWDELGDARLAVVNYMSGGRTGLVQGP